MEKWNDIEVSSPRFAQPATVFSVLTNQARECVPHSARVIKKTKRKMSRARIKGTKLDAIRGTSLNRHLLNGFSLQQMAFRKCIQGRTQPKERNHTKHQTLTSLAIWACTHSKDDGQETGKTNISAKLRKALVYWNVCLVGRWLLGWADQTI
jgi:hypothetical protein